MTATEERSLKAKARTQAEKALVKGLHWTERGKPWHRAFWEVGDVLARHVHEALPQEHFRLSYIAINIGIPTESVGIHTDDTYFVGIYPFAFKTTHLFSFADGKAALHQAPKRAVTILTGTERQAAIGIPAVIHRFPPDAEEERLALIFSFMSTKPHPGLSQKAKEKEARHIALAEAAFA